MKKPTPTLYKDFIEQLNKSKSSNQIPTQKSIPKGMPCLHSHSPCHWNMQKSPSQPQYTHLSCDKKIANYANIDIRPSRKDRALCYHRFISEITSVMTQLFKAPSPVLLNTRISYIEYLETLKALKMIR
jgi:hypothetical protein